MSHFYEKYKNLLIKLIVLSFFHKIFLKIVHISMSLRYFLAFPYILLILHVPTGILIWPKMVRLTDVESNIC